MAKVVDLARKYEWMEEREEEAKNWPPYSRMIAYLYLILYENLHLDRD
jgi:hypothetical protein